MSDTSPWFHPSGSLAREGWDVVVDDRMPGWRHTGLRVGRVGGGVDGAAASALELAAGGVERMIVPLEGAITVEYDTAEHDGETAGGFSRIDLAPRRDVFHGPGDVVYLGVGVSARITGEGRVAVAEAPASERIPVQVMRAAEVPVELRGAGSASRQVHNFGVPGALRAEKLIVCEVITPSGNWSSHPAHKHDEDVAGVESRLEEIYYVESAVARGAGRPDPVDPVGTFAVRSSDVGEIELDATVRSGDVVLVPYGFHGPAGAVPGYDLYYLNVMAGPDPDRAWRIRDDPAQAWVRETWAHQAVDPRLPYKAEDPAAPTATPEEDR